MQTIVIPLLYIALSLCAVAAGVSPAWADEKPGVYLVSNIAEKHSNEATRRFFGKLYEQFGRLEKAEGVAAEFLYSNSSDVNAFATIVRGRDVVVIDRGLISFYRGNVDALTFALAHELGHVKHHHVREGAQADKVVKVLTGLAGLALDVWESNHHPKATGVGSIGATVGSTLIVRAFTRDQEREADNEAVIALAALGMDPNIGWRAMEMLTSGVNEPLPILATHPSSAERVALLKEEATREMPVYLAKAEATRANNDAELQAAKRHEESRAEVAEKGRRERAALDNRATEAIATRKDVLASEETALSIRREGSHRSTDLSDVHEECKDLSPTRRTCLGQDVDGNTYIKHCNLASGEWKCSAM
jgi:Zn-dependent protease with chaperone function